MGIIAVRIDGRLIHGQVAAIWTTYLRASRIMVIDDVAAESSIEKAGLKMATPPGVHLSVLPISKAAENILSGKYDNQKVFIVARRPGTLLKVAKLGVHFDHINVGNMSKIEGSRPIAKTVHVVDEDIAAFKELDQLNVKLTLQMVPNDESKKLMDAL